MLRRQWKVWKQNEKQKKTLISHFLIYLLAVACRGLVMPGSTA